MAITGVILVLALMLGLFLTATFLAGTVFLLIGLVMRIRNRKNISESDSKMRKGFKNGFFTLGVVFWIPTLLTGLFVAGLSIRSEMMHRKEIGPFYTAIENGRVLKIKRFLKTGEYEINGVYQETTPLFFAVRNGEKRAALYLLERGADFSWISDNGKTILMEAIYSFDPEMVQFVIDQGADVPEDILLTFSRNSEACGQLEIFQILIENGAQIEIENDDGNTPFMLVSDKVDATINSYNFISKTQRDEYAAVLDFLLEQGADINHRNKSGKSALDNALENNYDVMGDFLRTRGAED